MLFTKSIHETLFRELARHQDHTTQSLHKAVAKHEEISLSNFYRIINDLITQQILTKDKGKIRLHTGWVLSLLEFTDTVKEHYIDQKKSFDVSLQDGEKKIFHTSSLLDLDNLWANIISSLAFEAEDTGLYMYNSHAYHILGVPETETTNFKNMQKELEKVYLLVGNETVMDQYAAEILRQQGEGIHVVCNQQHQFLTDGHFLNIVGEYILETLLPKIIIDYLNMFFTNVQEVKDFNPEGFQRIFTMKSDCKITVRRSKKEAENYKQEIAKYFVAK